MKKNRGIYIYFDNKKNKVVYIGKDSYIHKNLRHQHHMNENNYNKQHINKVIQNNVERYSYMDIANNIKSEKELNFLERYFIQLCSPIFNFTKGGDGLSGFKMSEEAKKKMSISHTKNLPRVILAGFDGDKQLYAIIYNKKRIVRSFDKEFLEKMIDKYFIDLDNINVDLIKKNIKQEQKLNESNTNYIEIALHGDRYSYYKDGKRSAKNRLKRSKFFDKIIEWAEENNMPLTKNED